MGGGSYDGEVARTTRATNQDVFTYQGYVGAPGCSCRTNPNPPPSAP
jgi:hypothetical protein